MPHHAVMPPFPLHVISLMLPVSEFPLGDDGEDEVRLPAFHPLHQAKYGSEGGRLWPDLHHCPAALHRHFRDGSHSTGRLRDEVDVWRFPCSVSAFKYSSLANFKVIFIIHNFINHEMNMLKMFVKKIQHVDDWESLACNLANFNKCKKNVTKTFIM